jgi:hypothetical protein
VNAGGTDFNDFSMDIGYIRLIFQVCMFFIVFLMNIDAISAVDMEIQPGNIHPIRGFANKGT